MENVLTIEQQHDLQRYKIFNKRLSDIYGLSIDGKPKYRLIWTENTFEKRHGTFSKFYGPLWLGEHTGIELAKKYSFLLNRFVLERYAPEATRNPEIDSDGYECFYVFHDKDRNYLPLREDMINFAVQAHLTSVGGDIPKKNDHILESEDQVAFNNEVKGIEEALQ